MTQVKTYLSNPILAIWQMKDYGETIPFQETIFGNDSRFHAKIRLKIAPQKQNFAMAKILSKHYALDCSCIYPWTFLHSYT